MDILSPNTTRTKNWWYIVQPYYWDWKRSNFTLCSLFLSVFVNKKHSTVIQFRHKGTKIWTVLSQQPHAYHWLHFTLNKRKKICIQIYYFNTQCYQLHLQTCMLLLSNFPRVVWTLPESEHEAEARRHGGQSHRKLRLQTISHPAPAEGETLPPFTAACTSTSTVHEAVIGRYKTSQQTTLCGWNRQMCRQTDKIKKAIKKTLKWNRK